jgi:flavin-dependent dehydrogenase
MTLPTITIEAAATTVWDAIVLGGGPSGSLAARQLAAAGYRVLLVEKKPFPRGKVCGACLNGAALGVLRSVGLGGLVHELGGVPLEGFELCCSGSTVRLSLPAGAALSRSRFDAALVDAAIAAGADFLPETQGLFARIEGNARQVLLVKRDRTATALARVVIAATGLSDAGSSRDPRVRTQTAARSRVGAGCSIVEFPDYYREHTIFMALGREGYVGLVRVEGGYLNVAAAFKRAFIQRSGTPAAAAAVVLSQAGLPAAPAFAKARWQGTGPLSRRTRPLAAERVFLLGDSAGYIEPFTGEGMSWALTSAQAIESIARQGIARWDPTLPRAWTVLYERLVGRRQCLCRVLAPLLRFPWLVEHSLKLAAQAPWVAGLLIRRVNVPSAFSPPG